MTDQTPTGAGTVKEVVVGVRSGTDTDWTFVNLAQSRRRIAAALDGRRRRSAAREFEYFVQAVDAAGNVAVSTNKGFYFAGAIAPGADRRHHRRA